MVKEKLDLKRILIEKKIIIIGIFIVIFVISLISSIFIFNIYKPEYITENEKIYYIATDDIYFTSIQTPDYFYNKAIKNENSVCIIGGDDGTATENIAFSYIRFDLTNKPNNYIKCEIRLYVRSVYERTEYSIGSYIDLFEGNWNEEHGNTEIYWKIESVFGIGKKVGFKLFDITNYIKNNDTISLGLFPSRQSGGRWTQLRIYIFSSEWDGKNPLLPYIVEGDEYKEYLPQLIWS